MYYSAAAVESLANRARAARGTRERERLHTDIGASRLIGDGRGSRRAASDAGAINYLVARVGGVASTLQDKLVITISGLLVVAETTLNFKKTFNKTHT